MPEEMRAIRCHHFRATNEPCMEPATVEVVGPTYSLYCEEHARQRAEENLPERWEQSDPISYARECEAALSQLYRWENESGYGVLYEVLTEARHYLSLYELRRARAQLEAAGGKPHATDEEREMLRYFEESANEFGWTDEPPWVPRVREWIRAEEESRERRA